MKFPNKFISFGVGALTLIIVAELFGDFESFMEFFMMSIVCTAGITLVIWIPTLVLLGMIVISIIRFIFRIKTPLKIEKNIDQSVEKKITKPLSSSELSVIGYIVSCRNTGTIDDMTIRSNLKISGGWSDKEIDNAFERCEPKL